MSAESDKLRAQAARLFAMAMDARDEGDDTAAEAFTIRADEYIERATDIERGTQAPPPAPPSQQVTQQQQQQLQPPPKKDE
jgi:hypothetical protein